MNLLELLRNAGGGEALSAFARAYGMSEEELGRALETLLPAFSAGLKRRTADPVGMLEFLRRLGSGDFLRAYSNPAWALGAGRPQGEEALNFLFGGPETWRAFLGEAAKSPGVPHEKLGEIFPAVAAMLFGGLAKQAAAANPALATVMQQFGESGRASRASKGPLDRYEEAQTERDRSPADDLLQRQNEMMQAGLAAFQAGTAAWQKAVAEALPSADGSKAAPPGPQTPGSNLFGDMFEPGLRLSQAYQREMEAVLDRLRPETGRS